MFVQAQTIAHESKRFPFIVQIDNNVNEMIAIDSAAISNSDAGSWSRATVPDAITQSLCLRSRATSVTNASVSTSMVNMDGMRRVIRSKSSLNKE